MDENTEVRDESRFICLEQGMENLHMVSSSPIKNHFSIILIEINTLNYNILKFYMPEKAHTANTSNDIFKASVGAV